MSKVSNETMPDSMIDYSFRELDDIENSDLRVEGRGIKFQAAFV